MNEDEEGPQIRNLSNSISRRMITITQSLEESVRLNAKKIDELLNYQSQQYEIIKELKLELRELETQRIFYIFLGICIGLAGRQILTDVISLIGK